MLIESLQQYRSRIIESFREATEFRAITELSFIYANEYVSEHKKDIQITLAHSSYGKHLGIADQKLNGSNLPKHLGKAAEHFFPFVHQHHVSLFEHLFFDLLRIILLDQPESLSRKKQIDYAIILEAESKADIIWKLIDRELNEIKYKNIGEWFTYLYKLVSIPQLSKDDIEQISEAKASRDILVHNGGIVNQLYIQKSGKAARFKEGESVDISRDYISDIWDIFSRVLLSMTDAIIEKHSHKIGDA